MQVTASCLSRSPAGYLSSVSLGLSRVGPLKSPDKQPCTPSVLHSLWDLVVRKPVH